jgi:leucine-rich PPR motif-containing protein
MYVVCLSLQREAPDVVTLNSLLDAYVRCGEVGAAKRLLEGMGGGGAGGPGGAWRLPAPDVYSFNTLLRGLGQAGDAQGAAALFGTMRGLGVPPDPVSVNTLVTAFTKAGQLDAAMELLSSSSVAASVEGYTALLDALADRGKFDQVRCLEITTCACADD